MPDSLKVCAVSQNIVDGSVHENLISAASLLREVETDTDLVILPELFSTGYISAPDKLKELAETNDGHTIDSVRRWAQFFGFAIAGSFLATDDAGHYYNRGFFVEPGGDVTFYDKRHLFTLSRENTIYTPGHTHTSTIRFRGWDIKLIICFDLRFPVWIRTAPCARFDLIICPAAWGGARINQFKTLLAARAIENQAYCISCNRTGADNYGTYPSGMSLAYDFTGQEIQETRRNGLIYAMLYKQDLAEARSKFPVADAADEFSIY